MIEFGAIVPHPPILLPEVGRGRERQAQATLDAYQVIVSELRQRRIARVLMISTHGIVTLNRFHILTTSVTGDLRRFDPDAPSFDVQIDRQLTEAVVSEADVRSIPLQPVGAWEPSDHSLGVPRILLADALPERVAVFSISFRSPADHLRLGEAVGAALTQLDEPTAIIASGDAVHRLSDISEYGVHREAERVQQAIESAIRDWDHDALLSLDEDLRRDVDESIVSPTLILMGATQGVPTSSIRPRMLSSERPWGVGYVTALIDLNDNSASP